MTALWIKCQYLVQNKCRNPQHSHKIAGGSRLYCDGCISSWVETCRGVVSLCAYRKRAVLGTDCWYMLFFPSSLEHCNAMRILSVWATSQTHWGGQRGGVGVVVGRRRRRRRKKKEAEAVSKFTDSSHASGHTDTNAWARCHYLPWLQRAARWYGELTLDIFMHNPFRIKQKLEMFCCKNAPYLSDNEAVISQFDFFYFQTEITVDRYERFTSLTVLMKVFEIRLVFFLGLTFTITFQHLKRSSVFLCTETNSYWCWLYTPLDCTKWQIKEHCRASWVYWRLD